MKKTLEFDLYGHATSVKWWHRFGAVEMTPTKIVEVAAATGLNGVAIADHDSITGLDEALEAGAKYGIIVIPGVVITAHENLAFPHILVLGLDSKRLKDGRRPIFKTIERVAHWARDLGAMVVAPHPGIMRPKEAPTSLTYEMLEKNIGLFDAVQTHDIESGFNQAAHALALKHRKPRIGGSDFYLSEQVGIARTRIFSGADTWQEAVEAIRRGRVEPFFHQNRSEDEVRRFSRAMLLAKRVAQFGKRVKHR